MLGDTGLLVLAADNTIEMSNEAAGRWLDELATAGRGESGLPLAVRAAAAQARAAAAGGTAGGTGTAHARVRTRAGHWLIVRGSMLGDGPGARAAVLLEAARPAELAPLIADAYGFTERERLVCELVARGFPTSEITRRAHLSAYTVQDHLKSVFLPASPVPGRAATSPPGFSSTTTLPGSAPRNPGIWDGSGHPPMVVCGRYRPWEER